ncbi:MAG: hypothetical protein ACJATL_000946 [Rickettsiales bacterium]
MRVRNFSVFGSKFNIGNNLNLSVFPEAEFLGQLISINKETKESRKAVVRDKSLTFEKKFMEINNFVNPPTGRDNFFI